MPFPCTLFLLLGIVLPMDEWMNECDPNSKSSQNCIWNSNSDPQIWRPQRGKYKKFELLFLSLSRWLHVFPLFSCRSCWFSPPHSSISFCFTSHFAFSPSSFPLLLPQVRRSFNGFIASFVIYLRFLISFEFLLDQFLITGLELSVFSLKSGWDLTYSSSYFFSLFTIMSHDYWFGDSIFIYAITLQIHFSYSTIHYIFWLNNASEDAVRIQCLYGELEDSYHDAWKLSWGSSRWYDFSVMHASCLGMELSGRIKFLISSYSFLLL